MAVQFVNAAAQPILNQEILVATLAGPLDNLDAFVRAAAWPDGVLSFFVYATVGGVRAKVATAIYQGPKAGRLQWSVGSQPAAAPVHAGGTSYDLVVLAQATQNSFPGALSPSQPPAIQATFAGVNESDVVADANVSATVPVGAGEATIVTAAGFNQTADVAAVMTGMPALDFRLYASCGAGSVEVVIAEQTTQGPDLIASVIRGVALPVATIYRLACSLSNPGGTPVNVTASLSTYQNTLPPAGTIPNPATWTQADWYVDWTNGNDANDGKTPATAVKTVMGGVVAKWGTVSPILAQTTTIHILTPQPLNAEQIILEPILSGLIDFIIVGTPQLVAHTNLGAVTAKNRAANVQFAAAGFGGAGIAVGQLVHNTTAGKDSWGFIYALPGGGVADLTQPLAPMTPGVTTLFVPAPAEVDTWAIGDTVDVFEACALNLRSLIVHGGSATDPLFIHPNVWVRYIKVLDAGGAPGNSTFAPIFPGNYVTLESCMFQPSLVTTEPSFEANVIQCYMGAGCWPDWTYIAGGIVTLYGLETTGINWLDADLILQSSAGLSGECILGFVNILNTVAGHGGAELRIETFTYGSSFVWGAGTINLQIESSLWNTSGKTWVNCLSVPTLQAMGLAFGSGYVGGGVFNDGIAITPANLDLWQGLQNVRGGARYSSLQPNP